MSEPAYRIRRSDRARRVRVNVGPERGVEVVLPRRAAAREAREAVAELTPWIERRLAGLARARADRALPPGVLPCLDERLLVVGEPGRQRAHRDAGRLLVPDADPRAALERWYRRAAREEVEPRLDDACARAGLRYRSLSIRAQRTRWASCSASGEMSFNWRLLLGPAAVLDAVVWHEVCHLAVPDHSRRFRALLARHDPGHREQERWLRDYGSTLRLEQFLAFG